MPATHYTLLPIPGRITFKLSKNNGMPNSAGAPQPDENITKSDKVFLRGRGKIRGGAKKWVLIRKWLGTNALHNIPNSLILRGSKRNRGGAKKNLKAG